MKKNASEMNDPRMVLVEKLVDSGLPKKLAFTIALDAGSSQTIVGKEYIQELCVSKEFEEVIFDKVSRFYFGYYSE